MRKHSAVQQVKESNALHSRKLKNLNYLGLRLDPKLTMKAASNAIKVKAMKGHANLRSVLFAPVS